MTDAGARERRLQLLTIAIPTVLAALLAAYELTVRSLWLDEAASVAISSQHGAALWHAIGHDGGNMVAYYLLLHVLIALFGDGVAVIRLPSVIATAATAGFVAALGLRLFDRRVALSAGLLAAVSLPLVFWGQDARGYALMTAFAVGSYLALAWILGEEYGRPPRAAFVLYVLSTTLAIYMGLIAILVVAAQLALLPFARRYAREIVLALVVVAACCVPLAIMALDRGSGQLFWVPKPDHHVLGQAARALTSAGYEPNFHRAALANLTLVLTGALLVVALAVIAVSGRGRFPYGDRAAELLIASWFVVPVLIAVITAKAGVPVELSRATLLVQPAVALLLAWLLAHPRVPVEVGWLGVAVLLVLRALTLAPAYGVSPEPWNAATASVLASSPDRACVAFYPQDGRMPFDYYLDAGAVPGAGRLMPVYPAAPWSVVAPYVERYQVPTGPQLAAIVRRCPVLWLVASHEGQRAGPPASRADHRRYQAFLAALALRYTRQRGYTFGWAAVIRTFRFSTPRRG